GSAVGAVGVASAGVVLIGSPGGAPPLPPKMATASSSASSANQVGGCPPCLPGSGTNSSNKAAVIGGSIGGTVPGPMANSLLGAVPPAPHDPFTPVGRSAAGTPLSTSSSVALSAMAVYTQAWNCSTDPAGAAMGPPPQQSGPCTHRQYPEVKCRVAKNGGQIGSLGRPGNERIAHCSITRWSIASSATIVNSVRTSRTPTRFH
ncbi:phosphatidylinositol 4-phosphate 3-kinase C2 domain-containing subunit alpha-like, partial [Tropilaelaps mercedesae]